MSISSVLEPLTPQEEQTYGNLGTMMSGYHSHIKREYLEVYELADGTFEKRGMSLHSFLQSALQFQQHLHAHHTVEEQHVFPVLAEKMPSFRDNEKHRKSHQGIHDGLESLVTLVSRFQSEPTTYSPTEMRACLDSFREVMMTHLDEEVNELRAENMRNYWTLEEISRFPW